MARNIVICADGTGNTFETNVSNVVRLVTSLRLSDGSRQIVLYDQGVGTRAHDVRVAKSLAREKGWSALHILPAPKALRVVPPFLARQLGRGFGYGLAENVAQMYGELAGCYSDGDRLYLFGFSRGAFTVRVLAGLLHRCGLLPPRHLDQFQRAFELYEVHYQHLDTPAELERQRANVCCFRQRYGVRNCDVHFLGLWDTVKSYGFLVPKSLPHLRHNPSVKTVRHALALDERRSYFQATSWGGVDDPNWNDSRPGDSADVQEVWFPGSHADVGGGYPASESGSARAPFTWMIQQAQRYRLEFDERELEAILRAFPAAWTAHDSLNWKWWPVELLPRMELENIPIPGVRVIKWGSSGRRNLAHFSRGGAVRVHASTLDLYRAREISLPLGQRVVIVPDAQEALNNLSPAVISRADPE
jgi:uncharacterized protein (DUF2235 family)